jgi:aromatic-L-amino-acid/L-tryptophan decarboxylase
LSQSRKNELFDVLCFTSQHERKTTLKTTDTTQHASFSSAVSATRGPSALEMDVETFYQLGMQAVEMATEYLEGIPEKPVYRPMTPSERQLLLYQQLPEYGRSPEALFDFFEQHILPHAMGNQHPRFAAWVNPAGAPIGMLAEFLAAVMNPSAAGGDHAAIYVEHCMVRWLMELIDFPIDGSSGILVGGGSVASLYCLAVARHWAAAKWGWNMRTEGLQGHYSPLVLYISEEGHSCLRKASHLLGLGEPRIIPVDTQYKMDLNALREAVLADFCEDQGIWLHVDGAYGAFGILDPNVTHLYTGLECADSVALDPHKWLATPIECSCAIVRQGDLLRETFSLVPPYLRTDPDKGFGGMPWFAEYGFQQTRRFNALKLMWVIQQAGRTGLVAHVTRHNTLAQYMASLVDDVPNLELMAPVELSIVCFRYVPDSLQEDEGKLDGLNKRIMEEIQARGKAFVNGTILHGRFVLRSCALHYALTEDDVVAMIEEVCHVGEQCQS